MRNPAQSSLGGGRPGRGGPVLMSSQRWIMTYMLRERPDGHVEIIVHTPTIVGVFPDRGIAEKVRVWLQDDDAFGQVEDEPAGFATAAADVAQAEAEALADIAPIDAVPAFLRDQRPPPETLKPRQDRRKRVQMPAEDEKLRPPAMLPVHVPSGLSEEQINTAFARLTAGEKIAVVAPDFALTFNQLRGMWANYKRRLQAHLAEGGQENCAGCGRRFTPSISSPDKCARCSHD